MATKIFKYSVLAELYKLKLINKSLLFDLSEVIETNFVRKHRKKIETKLDIVQILPPIYHIEAANRILHNSNKISENAFFKGLDEYLIKQLLVGCKNITVPAGEFIYHAKQPSDCCKAS